MVKVINLSTREVLYEDKPKYAVYIVAIPDTSKAFDQLCEIDGLVEWQGVRTELSETEAIELANNLEPSHLGA